MNPLFRDDIVYRRPELTIDYRSARKQAANTHIEDDQETYIKDWRFCTHFVFEGPPRCHLSRYLSPKLLGLDFRW